MRILWHSVAPFCGSGYGMQTASVTKQLQQAGHEMAISCFFGVQGAKIDWGGIPIYPGDGSYGTDFVAGYYDDWKADLLITLVDVWVLNRIPPRLHWTPWLPVDHKPVPIKVLEVLKKSSAIIKPITMAKFGRDSLDKAGIDSYYIPHAVDCQVFKPDLTQRKASRERLGWEDKFVVGTVATNSLRKNWAGAMWAMSKLYKRHKDIIWYMHTVFNDKMGYNLQNARIEYGLKGISFFPDQTELTTGIPQEVMAKTYNAMDVFLLPSMGEGFGIPAVEAQACGCPVIVSNNTAQTELMGGGWLLDTQIPEWTHQNSFQFRADPREILAKLELAYKAWKKGRLEEKKAQARTKALEYDEPKIFNDYWIPTLKDIEEKIKEPRNLEGVQEWRLGFIPRECEPHKVLDIGCGVSQPYRSRLEILGEYVGIDTREGYNVTVMDAHHLDFQDKEFGFAWCSEMLEHVDNPEQVLAEAKRVSVHGVCLFSTPSNPYFTLDLEHKEVTIPHSFVENGNGLIVW